VLAAPLAETASSIEAGQSDKSGSAYSIGLHTAPSRLWLDRRAVEAAKQVSALAGGFVDPSFYLPKALDIKINEPALYENTNFFWAALNCWRML
jgi:sugar (pentulose or hexulose) kinase